MDSKTLEELIGKGESQNAEFKQSVSSARDLAKEIAAFANTCGGVLIIGVDDKGTITGIRDFKETEQTISNALNHNCIPPIQADISQIEVSGKILIAVDIPTGISKPYEANHVIYIRVGSSARPASREEKQDMYASSIKEGYDMLPVKDAVLDDLSKDEIIRYMQRRNARLNTPIEPFSEFLLMKLNAVVQLDGTIKPTVSGILLFGKEPQRFAETRLGYLRLARFKGKEVGTFIDQLDIYGTLTAQVDEAAKFVERNIRFGWTTERMPREKRYEYPLNVIKEAITNACAHRDYYENGTIFVSIFDDRITIQSPGSLPRGVRIENLEDECRRRNDNICQRLFEMGYIEAWGMGIDMMNREMSNAVLPKPLYRDTGASFIVTLMGPGEKWMTEEKPISHENLNERQRKAIDYIKKQGSITNIEYRELAGLGREYVRKELNDMVAKGILIRKGKGRSIHYILVGN